jgi:hypothetical protein
LVSSGCSSGANHREGDANFLYSRAGTGWKIENGEDGIRTLPENKRKTIGSRQSGAISGALDSKNVQNDANLNTLIEVWPQLPEAIRAGVMAMVRAASGAG